MFPSGDPPQQHSQGEESALTAVNWHQKLPLRREAASPGLGCQILNSSSNDIFEILGQQVPSRAQAVSPHHANTAYDYFHPGVSHALLILRLGLHDLPKHSALVHCSDTREIFPHPHPDPINFL